MNSNMPEDKPDLLVQWFLDIGKARGMYKEPILSPNSVKLFKQICDTLDQNTHVFIMSIEVAEDYLRAKRSKKQAISDPLLATVTIAFICHKCEGAPEGLKMQHIIDLLYFFTKKIYKAAQVLAMEGDILVTLKGKLPVTTVLDDMDIIVEKYMGEALLQISVRPMCLRILECAYVERLNWFKELKNLYSQTRECMVVLRNLITSKFYLPVGILVTAIELTNYRDVMDVDTLLADVTKHTKIHEDHMRILVAQIMESMTIMQNH